MGETAHGTKARGGKAIWIRRGALTLAAVTGLVALGVGTLVLTVDPNRYKESITRLVKEKKNRQLTIRGDLKLTVFPRLGVEVGPAALSAHGEQHTALSIESARVSVALWPLLRRQVVIDHVAIEGLQATVTRRKDGSLDIDDLLQPSADPGPARFDVDGIELSRADLTYLDQRDKNRIKLTQLAFKSGRLADRLPTEVEWSAHVSSDLPPAAVRVAGKGRFLMDLAAGQFGLTQARMEAKGVMPSVKIDRLVLESTDLGLNAPGRHVRAKNLSLTFNGVVDNEPLEVRLATPSIAADLTRLAVQGQKLDVDVQASGVERKGSAKIEAARLDGRLADGVLDVDRLKVVGKGSMAGLQFSELQFGVPKLLVDLPRSRLSLEGVALRSIGAHASGEKFDVRLDAPRLDVSETQAAGSGIKGSLRWVGEHNADIKYRIENVRGHGKDLTADLHVEGKVEGADMAARPVPLAIQGTLNSNLNAETLSANVQASFDQSRVRAILSVEHFAKPIVNVVANVDRLNLDRYRSKLAAGPGTKADAAIDLSVLKGLNLGGQVKVGELQVQNLKASGVEMAVRVANGRAEIREMSAGLYGGTLFGSALLDGNTNAFAFKHAIKGVQVQPLMKDLANRDAVEGTGTIHLDVTGSGKTVAAAKKSLAGTVRLQVRDGAIRGFDLAKSLRDFRRVLGHGADPAAPNDKREKTEFSELDAHLALAGGVATVRELQIKSPLVRATQGEPARIDIGNGQLDLMVRATVANTTTGPLAKDLKDLRGLVIPVRFVGPFERWQYQVQWADVAGQGLRNSAERALRDALPDTDKSAPKKDAAPKKDTDSKPADQIRDRLLRGLLGGQ
jgi:AsmA protein